MGSVFQAVFAVVCPGFDGGTLEALMGKWLLGTCTGQHEIFASSKTETLFKKKKMKEIPQRTFPGSNKNIRCKQQVHLLTGFVCK